MDRLVETVRLHRSGITHRKAAQMLRMGPNTHRTAREALAVAGLWDGPADELPPPEALRALLPQRKPRQQVTSIESWRTQLEDLEDLGLNAKTIHDRLTLNDPSFKGSYDAVKRAVASLRSRRPISAEVAPSCPAAANVSIISAPRSCCRPAPGVAVRRQRRGCASLGDAARRGPIGHPALAHADGVLRTSRHDLVGSSIEDPAANGALTCKPEHPNLQMGGRSDPRSVNGRGCGAARRAGARDPAARRRRAVPSRGPGRRGEDPRPVRAGRRLCAGARQRWRLRDVEPAVDLVVGEALARRPRVAAAGVERGWTGRPTVA